jgi:hypothetical protein
MSFRNLLNNLPAHFCLFSALELWNIEYVSHVHCTYRNLLFRPPFLFDVHASVVTLYELAFGRLQVKPNKAEVFHVWQKSFDKRVELILNATRQLGRANLLWGSSLRGPARYKKRWDGLAAMRLVGGLLECHQKAANSSRPWQTQQRIPS